MRNLPKLLFQRVVVVSLAILLQILFVIAGMDWLREYWHWMKTAMDVVKWVAVLTIMTGRSNPSYKMAWIILILAFPVAGITIYLLFGGNRISNRENRRMNRVEVMVAQHLRQEKSVMQALEREDIPAWNHARYLLSSSRYPVYDNSAAVYFPSGESCYARMLEELEKAEHYIFLEFFIINNGKMWDSILDILHRKAMQGVDVRVLYDDFGCITRLPMRYCKKLREMGIEAHVFNPFIPVLSGRLNNRDHRKLMLIDGKVDFTGGVNLADEYINEIERFGHWKDSAILLEGDAVWSMAVMFLTMWDHCCGWEEEFHHFRPEPAPARPWTGYVQPYTDTPLDREAVGQAVYLNMIGKARKYIYITTPYLVIDVATNTALCNAAKSGVDVRIITPHIPDKRYVFEVTRAHYPPLLEAGVRIYEYTPGFIHAKNFVVDDRFATVGTVNLDYRSLFLHFEDGVWLCEAPCIQDIRRDFEETLRVCQRISLRQRKYFNPIIQLYRNILRIFAPLM